MPPKPKEAQIVRPSLSDSSFLNIPADVVEGFQERLEFGIDWTISELAIRHHKEQCARENIPKRAFSEALQWKLNNSVFKGFFDVKSKMKLRDHWELTLPTAYWENEKFSNEEGKICFQNQNSITDNLFQLVKKSVIHDDRDLLLNGLKLVEDLRLIGTKMTELDDELKQFKQLISLNMCGNFLKDIDASSIPDSLRSLELQLNRIQSIEGFARELPADMIYLGLSKNLITCESIESLCRLPLMLCALDLGDNDIYDLEKTLHALAELPNLESLQLAGNPCSFCAGYARLTLDRLPRLRWLDQRQVLDTDRSVEPFEPHPNDLKSAFFVFNVLRIISTPQPPKPEKGVVTSFYVELELPLLDSTRRFFLMYRRNESLEEVIRVPPCEDDDLSSNLKVTSRASTKGIEAESSSHESDIYKQLKRKDSKIIHNYTTFKSNPVQWNKFMTFQNPVVKIFIPDLRALKHTFHSVITVRFVYNMIISAKSGKEKKSDHVLLAPGEQEVVLATVKCALRNPDWSQPTQHFHWDNTLETDEAIHWGQGDLSVIQYVDNKPTAKGKSENSNPYRQNTPENLTCHFGFGIETIQVG